VPLIYRCGNLKWHIAYTLYTISKTRWCHLISSCRPRTADPALRPLLPWILLSVPGRSPLC
jgi:hypothetical protein